jgi:hypothetical protein
MIAIEMFHFEKSGTFFLIKNKFYQIDMKFDKRKCTNWFIFCNLRFCLVALSFLKPNSTPTIVVRQKIDIIIRVFLVLIV